MLREPYRYVMNPTSLSNFDHDDLLDTCSKYFNDELRFEEMSPNCLNDNNMRSPDDDDVDLRQNMNFPMKRVCLYRGQISDISDFETIPLASSMNYLFVDNSYDNSFMPPLKNWVTLSKGKADEAVGCEFKG